jgi:hypothetical protein
MRKLATVLTLTMLGIVPALAQPAPPPGPPPLREEVVPPPPGATYVWEPGQWRWNGATYVWVPGHYIAPHRYHRYGAHWIPGHWRWAPRLGRWVWEQAHWG